MGIKNTQKMAKLQISPLIADDSGNMAQ